MCQRKLGEDVGEQEGESFFDDSDGTKWEVTEGRGLLKALDQRKFPGDAQVDAEMLHVFEMLRR